MRGARGAGVAGCWCGCLEGIERVRRLGRRGEDGGTARGKGPRGFVSTGSRGIVYGLVSISVRGVYLFVYLFICLFIQTLTALGTINGSDNILNLRTLPSLGKKMYRRRRSRGNSRFERVVQAWRTRGPAPRALAN